MSDRAVSELLGYSIVASAAIVATFCLLSGASGVLSSTLADVELAGATLALKSFGCTATEVARDNNTCITALEIAFPGAYELSILDQSDDCRAVRIRCGDREMAAARLGSLRLRSPFRSVSYEGGAAFSNDSGRLAIVKRPEIYVNREGDNVTLYLCLICISADSRALPGGSPVTLKLRSATVVPSEWAVPPGADTTIVISSGETQGWIAILKGLGFATHVRDSVVTATSGEITDVHFVCRTVRVDHER